MSRHERAVWEVLGEVVENVAGWSPVEELFALYEIAAVTAPLGGDILEIGSWCGRSSVALALACRDVGIGTVHACDLFPTRDDWWRNEDGTYSFAVEVDGRRLGAYEDQTVWAEPYERDVAPLYETADGIYDLFQASIEKYGVTDLVKPLRGDSLTFAEQAGSDTRIRLAFVDGDHGFDAVCQDIDIAERFLVPGGWIAFDDAFTSYDGVDEAINKRIIDDPRFGFARQLTRKMFVACKLPDGI